MRFRVCPSSAPNGSALRTDCGAVARADRHEPRDEAEERGFAAAGGSHDRHELAAADVERDVLDGGEFPVLARQRETLGHLLEDDAARAIAGWCRRRRDYSAGAGG